MNTGKKGPGGHWGPGAGTFVWMALDWGWLEVPWGCIHWVRYLSVEHSIQGGARIAQAVIGEARG